MLPQFFQQFSVQLCGGLAAFGSSFASPLAAAEPTASNVSTYAYLAGAEIRSPKVPSYERTERDPFVDATVKLTLLSQKNEMEPAPEEGGVGQIVDDLSSELLRTCKISGVVCGENDGLVLIGRRILRTGDKLELLLGEEMLKKMWALERTQHLGWGDFLSLGILACEIKWITPTGIGLSHALLEEPLTLPFQKNTPPPLPFRSSTIPK
jgi:hypothetical protein